MVSLVDEENIQILRQGPISKEELEEVLGQQIANPGNLENKEPNKAYIRQSLVCLPVPEPFIMLTELLCIYIIIPKNFLVKNLSLKKMI